MGRFGIRLTDEVTLARLHFTRSEWRTRPLSVASLRVARVTADRQDTTERIPLCPHPPRQRGRWGTGRERVRGRSHHGLKPRAPCQPGCISAARPSLCLQGPRAPHSPLPELPPGVPTQEMGRCVGSKVEMFPQGVSVGCGRPVIGGLGGSNPALPPDADVWGWSWTRTRTCSQASLVPGPVPETPLDCEVSLWSSWGLCGGPCGQLGAKSRTRYIRVQPANQGAPCPELEEEAECVPDNCV